MTDEVDLQHLTVIDLAKRCAQETKLYFKYQDHNTNYCFELFRRAISERDDPAWNAIMIQYKPSVSRWVNRWADKHPDFPLANEEQEDFIAEAFERFWHYFTPDKFGKSQSLPAVLRYLQMCVNGAISDTWRKLRREQFNEQLDENDDGEEKGPYEADPTPEENVQNNEIWKLIQIRLKDESEQIIVYASIFLGLSPREIFAEFPGRFLNIKEVYQCKANVWARLGRDLYLRDLLQNGA